MTGPHRLVRPVYTRDSLHGHRPTRRHVHTSHVRAPEHAAVLQCCCGVWVTGAVARGWTDEVQPVPIGRYPVLLRYAAGWLLRFLVAGFFTGRRPAPYRSVRELRRRQKLVREAVRAERTNPTVTLRRDPRERWWRKW